MAKYKQSKEELRNHLIESLNFLKASSSSFDAGFYGEAKRLALTIRVLVHDTDKSKSLLGLLGMKAAMGFFDTANDVYPNNLTSHLGLIGVRSTADGKGGVSVGYFAPLNNLIIGRPNKFVFFPGWWNKVVIVDLKKNRFSRRE